MRILTFLHSFDPRGVERDALRLNAELARQNVDVQLVLGRRDGMLNVEAPDLLYTVLQKGRISTAAFETLWMILRLPGAIRRLKPDVLFCAGNTYSIVAVAMRLFLGRRCPPIVLKVSNDLYRHDLPTLFRWAYYLWLRVQAPVFDAVVAMAEPARLEIETAMGIPAPKVVVINNPSLNLRDLEEFAQARDGRIVTASPRRFLAVGKLVSQKNFSHLLKSFARIARPTDHLTIIGEGYKRQSLEQLVTSLSLDAQVSLLGHRSPLFDRFAEADAFILSSDYEGLGVVVVEALAAGVPIVATDCCVNMSYLLEGAGLRVPIRDEAALADAMDKILNERIDPVAMRARAAEFAVERVTPAWIALFASLCRGEAQQTVAKDVGTAVAEPG
jgi:glycosyltransferase involved in cell wall biosynthesis